MTESSDVWSWRCPKFLSFSSFLGSLRHLGDVMLADQWLSDLPSREYLWIYAWISLFDLLSINLCRSQSEDQITITNAACRKLYFTCSWSSSWVRCISTVLRCTSNVFPFLPFLGQCDQWLSHWDIWATWSWLTTDGQIFYAGCICKSV
jgi:hypothetical protein